MVSNSIKYYIYIYIYIYLQNFRTGLRVRSSAFCTFLHHCRGNSTSGPETSQKRNTVGPTGFLTPSVGHENLQNPSALSTKPTGTPFLSSQRCQQNLQNPSALSTETLQTGSTVAPTDFWLPGFCQENLQNPSSLSSKPAGMPFLSPQSVYPGAQSVYPCAQSVYPAAHSIYLVFKKRVPVHAGTDGSGDLFESTIRSTPSQMALATCLSQLSSESLGLGHFFGLPGTTGIPRPY